MIEFFGCHSPNNDKIHIMLEEISAEYKHSYRSQWKLKQFEPEFVALNPNCKTPVITDQDAQGHRIVLWESGVILQYLAEKSGMLMPSDTIARYEVLKWVMFQMANIGPAMGNFFHFNRFGPDGKDYGWHRFKAESLRLLGVLEGRLAQSEFVGGPEYSIADIAVFPWLRYHGGLSVSLSDYPAIDRWFARVGRREAVQRALEKSDAAHGDFEETIRQTPPEVLDRVFNRTAFSKKRQESDGVLDH